jgi:hypothetical protein
VNRPKQATSGRPGWVLPAILVAVVAVVGAVLALVLGNQAPPYAAEVTGAPSAVVDTTVVDHGAVPYAQTVESVYRVRNVGDEPLVILGEPRVELVEGC